MADLHFTCALEHGIHARPASQLAEAVRPFSARVELMKKSSRATADVRSVLSVVGLDVAYGDECVLSAAGDDANDAIAALQVLIEQGFGEAAAAGAERDARDNGAALLPSGLQRLGARWIPGRGISPGFAQGLIVIVRSLIASDDHRSTAGLPDVERKLTEQAIHQVREAIRARIDGAGAELERDLLRAHMSIADDPALHKKIEAEIDAGASAVTAIRRAGEAFVRTLRGAASAYIRDRAIDVEDVCQQLLERLGAAVGTGSIELHGPSIIAADLLTPRQMMSIDRKLARALVLGRVGATSHTAILARAFGIPALVDVHDAETSFHEGQNVIVDATGGFVLPDVTPHVQRYYAIEQRAVERRRRRLAPFAAQTAKTKDDVRLEIAANISTADEVEPVIVGGAEGIGLFRTEMLFLDRPAAPSEEEQFEAYTRAIEGAGGRTVIIRTFDIGGDKPAPYLRLPREENPFLGWRGIRLYEQFPDLVRAQLRAVARASAKGPVKVMAPMVANVREAVWFRQRVKEVQKELRGEGTAFDLQMPVGIMIEVPSAAMAIDHLAEVAEFFSIGTNDLCQYVMAVDRGNPRVARLCNPLEPGLLRMLKLIIDEARRHKRWVGICGEMAGDPLHLPLMVGLGPDEISVAPGRVQELKALIGDLHTEACRELLSSALGCHDADQVQTLLTSFSSTCGGGALVDCHLVLIDSDAASKIEAIKELVGLVAAAGRASDGTALENAVWAREDTYATGLGFGFAIPHCKSDVVRIPTVAVVKLAQPIDWGSTDGELVSVAIMLAIPATGAEADAARAHMQVLAKLARQLMHEEFRDRIKEARNAEALVAVLTAGLEL